MRRWIRVTAWVSIGVLVVLSGGTPLVAQKVLGRILWKDTTWRDEVRVDGDTFVPSWAP